MSFPAISVSNLDYFYPDKQALENINVTIEKGEITALVGPNGAGKTTLMRCLAGLDTPFNGKISICGIDILEYPREGHSKLGYLSDDFGLYDELSVKNVLEYIAGCHNLPIDTAVATVIDRLNLGSVADKRCGALSRGWRQRVGIGMSIIHHPELLILDEPASGLDPEARSELSTILKVLQKEGMSILVSSHILSELEEYSTAMLVLRDGKIQQHITLDQHKASSPLSLVHVTLASPISTEQEDLVKQLVDLPPQSDQIFLSPDRKTITLNYKNTPDNLHNLLKSLINRNIPVCSFMPAETSLQNLYLELAKQTAN